MNLESEYLEALVGHWYRRPWPLGATDRIEAERRWAVACEAIADCADGEIPARFYDLLADASVPSETADETLAAAAMAWCSLGVDESTARTLAMLRYRVSSLDVALAQPNLAAFGNVRFFAAERSAIEALPPWIANMRSLEVIDISFTGIRELPEWLGELEELRFVDASHSALTTVPLRALSGPRLEGVRLRGTELSHETHRHLEIARRSSGRLVIEIA